MRWERLFADLEGQLAFEREAELTAEVADRTRRERARLRVVDRLRGALEVTVEVQVDGAGRVDGRVAAVGPDWLLLREPTGRDALVALAAVLWVAGLPPRAGEPAAAGAVAQRLGLGYVLRGLARDRATVSVTLRDGRGLTGTVDVVGADAVELAEHAADEPRRPGAVRRVALVPFAALAVVRSGRG